MKKKKRFIIGLIITALILSLIIKQPTCHFPEQIITTREPILEDITFKKDALEENENIAQFHVGMSMYPYLKPGQVCVCEALEEYRINDVITFYTYYEGHLHFIVHRIIDKIPSGFITKGDNNEFVDSNVIPNEQIFCKIKEESLLEKAVRRVSK